MQKEELLFQLTSIDRLLTDGSENRAKFFDRVGCFYFPTDWRYLLIRKAYEFAKNAHRSRLRHSGEREFEHLRGVALILMDECGIYDYRLLCVALLHDVLEDTDCTIEQLTRNFPLEIAIAVHRMSNTADNWSDNLAFHTSFLDAPFLVAAPKLADRLFNMRTLETLDRTRQARKIKDTRSIYLPLANMHGLLEEELRLAVTASEHRLGKYEGV